MARRENSVELSVQRFDRCLGCQLCADICPTEAISLPIDSEGKTVPTVDTLKCKNCGMCRSKCPAIRADYEDTVDSLYAAISVRNKHKGSSGSVFHEIAESWINDGGIVWGAAFDADLKLRHVKAVDMDSLKSLYKSKYVQSDCSGVYAEIGSLLAKGKKVLFVGCPCQVSAVKNAYVGKFREQLVLIDFLCHGTPPQILFDICRKHEEEKINGRITEFTFRAKVRKAEHSYSYEYTDNKTGKKKVKSGFAFEYPYYNAYLKYSIFRDGCYRCPYATVKRVGDLTIGDFWKIEKYSKRFSAQKGCSLIVTSTNRGKKLFESIRGKLKCEQLPLQAAFDNNGSFREPTKEDEQIRRKIRESFEMAGHSATIETYFAQHNMLRSKIYAYAPRKLIELFTYVKALIGKRCMENDKKL